MAASSRNVLDLKRTQQPKKADLQVDTQILKELQASIPRQQEEPKAHVASAPEKEQQGLAAYLVRTNPFQQAARRHTPSSDEGPTFLSELPSKKKGRRWRQPGVLSLTPWVFGAGIVILGLLYVSQYGIRAKNRVVQQSGAAISHMLSAKEDLSILDWTSAQIEFDQAYEQFNEAGRELDILGPAVVGLLDKIPGLHGISAGNNILQAGRLLSLAGSRISDSLNSLAQTSQEAPGAESVNFRSALIDLDSSLGQAADDVAEAKRLLEAVDPERVPEENRDQFLEFRERIPLLNDLIHQGANTVTFLRSFLGEGGAHRYLVLFQNNSELRPTGGFPGSYGLLTTQDGQVKDWRADDIYNPDGQVEALIVPPRQLQHITPGWGMRDANWFIDFPTSAKKVMEFWRRGGGSAVDGVIAIQPAVLAAILEATGPVAMPDYGVTVTSENAVATIQQEIEENRPTGEPKKIISDLAPILLDRLAALPTPQWPVLLQAFATALKQRDIQMYFKDGTMQQLVEANGWDGGVREAEGDFLLVAISNIKGAKSDAVTDTAMKLETRSDAGTLIHRLTITRRHNGGTSPYGFYNKTNYSFIRVLVPEGSTLRGVSGNDNPNIQPLIGYANAQTDPDLAALEATMVRSDRWNAITYQESGKTGFGFWMTVNPQRTDAVQIEYAVPASVATTEYQLTVQRQAGLIVDEFEFTLEKPGLAVADSVPSMTEWPDSWRLYTDLHEDRTIHVRLRE